MIRRILNYFRDKNALAKENEDLAKRLDAVMTGDWSKVKLYSIQDGQINLGGDVVRAIAEFFTQALEKEDGTYHNYMEVEFTSPRMGRAVLLCQRVSGETPNQMVKNERAKAISDFSILLYEEEGNVVNPEMANRILSKL